MSDHLHRIQAAYASHHLMGYDVAGLTTFTAIASWWRARELQREREQQQAEAAQEDQDGTHDPEPTR